MASTKEIELVGEIQRLAIRINMQGKYHTFVNYSGHVQSVDVAVQLAPYPSDHLDGWACNDHVIYLSTDYKLFSFENIKRVIADKIEQLEKLKSDLGKLLDVDADGVPA
jgi:DNA-directed RNA polymerase subunit L